MPTIHSVDKILSVMPKKRFGKPSNLGLSMFAFSQYGAEPLFLSCGLFGDLFFGDRLFGDIIELSGVFQTRHVRGSQTTVRTTYVTPKNPRTIPQQTNRAKMAAGVTAWQALSIEQKKVYNINAYGKGMSGYNLFLKIYLT